MDMSKMLGQVRLKATEGGVGGEGTVLICCGMLACLLACLPACLPWMLVVYGA